MQIPSVAFMTSEEILLASYSLGRRAVVAAPGGDPLPATSVAAPSNSTFPVAAAGILAGAAVTGVFAWLGSVNDREAYEHEMDRQAERLRALHGHYVGSERVAPAELDALWSMPIEARFGETSRYVPRRLFRDGSAVYYDPETGRPLRSPG